MEPWQAILESAGFPTQAIVLDFETYFDADYSLSKLSTVEYVMDARFGVVGLGYQTLGDGSQASGFLPPDEVGPYLAALAPNIDKYTVVVQNGKFDCLVLHERFGITPKYVVDILDLSRHLDARDRHSLDHLAKKYHAPTPKGDTKQFLGLHWADMNAEQRAAMVSYCRDGDVPIEAYLFKTLLPRLTWAPVELRLAYQTLRQFLVPQIKVDMRLGSDLIAGMQAELQQPIDKINSLGIRVITPSVRKRKGLTSPLIRLVTAADVSKDRTFISMLEAALPDGESVPRKQGKKKMIPALAKTDTALDRLLSHPEPRVRALMVARKATDSWPGHISRVRKLMAQAAARGGWLGVPLKYYGAGPGRWSGAEGINAQNFGARDVHDLIKQVGQMLTAPEGFTLGTGDLSQIEARVLAWFAGQEDLLEAFRQDRDIYSEFGTEQIYHSEVRKPRDDDPPELARVLKIRRDLSKETVLGAGYGMGGQKHYERCRVKPSLKDAFVSGDLTRQMCQRAIDVYRQRYSMIPAFWRELEKAWRFVARYRDQQATVSHYGRALQFWNEGGTVCIGLPSSRVLFYPHAAVSAADDTCRYHWGHVYGGLLTENVCQATARDIFGLGLLRMEDAGFNTLFSVHDQAVCLMRAGDTEALAEMHRLQTIVPPWAEGLPVATEGNLADRYHKT
jgi:DNA polymerase